MARNSEYVSERLFTGKGYNGDYALSWVHAVMFIIREEMLLQGVKLKKEGEQSWGR